MDITQLSVKEAVDMLAQRAAELRTRPRTLFEKEATRMGDVMSSIGDAVLSKPTLGHALIGSGLGAGAGALSTWLGNKDKEPHERKNILSSALTGGLAGGALGGGLGLARQGLGKMTDPVGVGGFKDQIITDPNTGQQFKITADQLKANPDLLKQVRELMQKEGPVVSGIGKVWNNVADVGSRALPGLNETMRGLGLIDGTSYAEEYAPRSTQLLPKLMLADALTNSPFLRMGERIGVGAMRPEFSNKIQHLVDGLGDRDATGISEGAAKDIASKPGVATSLGKDRLFRNMRYSYRPWNRDFWHYLRYGVFGDRIGGRRNVHTHNPPTVGEEVHKSTTEVGKTIPDTTTRTTKTIDPNPETVSQHQIQQAKRRGWERANPDGPKMITRVGPLQWTAPRWVRAGGRAGVYGLLPAAEIGMNYVSDEKSKEQKLRELIQQIAAPIPTDGN